MLRESFANALPDAKRRQLASLMLGIPTAEIDDAHFSVDKETEPPTVVVNVKLRRSVKVVHISGRIADGNPVG